MYDEELERKVRKRVKEKAGFMKHFSIYCVFVAFFFVLNIITSGIDDLWFYWPALGWGLGVAMHYVSVFGLPGSGDMMEKWEIEETAREMKKRREAGQKSLPSRDEADTLDLPNLEKEKRSAYEDEDFV